MDSSKCQVKEHGGATQSYTCMRYATYLHKRRHQLRDLDKHPVVVACRHQREEIRREREVVAGLLSSKLADDVHGARNDGGDLRSQQ